MFRDLNKILSRLEDLEIEVNHIKDDLEVLIDDYKESDKIIWDKEDLIFYLNKCGILSESIKEELNLYMKYYNKGSDDNE